MTQRPARVERARIEGDTTYLRAAGRQGGLAAARNRETRLIMQERIDEQRALDERARAHQANEHIIPPEIYDR